MKAGALNYLDKGSLTSDALRLAVAAAAQNKARRGAERALAESRAYKDAVVEASPDAFVVMDTDGRHLELLPRGSGVLPFPADELVGATVHDLLPPQYADPLLAAIREASSRGVTTSVELDLEALGTDSVLEGRFRPLPDGTVLAIIRDIGERRRLRRQLELGRRLEALGRLAGGVAHDFNNLLMVIESGNRLLADLARGSEYQEDSEAIAAAVLRGADLTQKLLAFSRSQQAEPVRLDLVAHVKDTHTLMGRMLGLHVACKLLLPPTPLFIQADGAQLDQVLLNLASNSKHADATEVVVEITAVQVSRDRALFGGATLVPGDYVRLQVRDDGRGMARGVLDRAFEPFFTTRDGVGGTGLGLATVWGVIEQWEGAYLDVESQPGAGTSFSFFLPAAHAAPARPRPVVLPPPELGRVLLVDDDALLRRAVERLLRRAGATVVVAADGESALALYAEHAIDLVLTDQMMPGMLGTELAARIGELGDTPVVVMSGYSTTDLGSVAALGKPFDLDAFYRIVRRVKAEAMG